MQFKMLEMKKKFCVRKLLAFQAHQIWLVADRSNAVPSFSALVLLAQCPQMETVYNRNVIVACIILCFCGRRTGHSETAQDAETIRTDRQADRRTDGHQGRQYTVHMYIPVSGANTCFPWLQHNVIFLFVLEQTKRTYAGLHDVQMWCSLLLLHMMHTERHYRIYVYSLCNIDCDQGERQNFYLQSKSRNDASFVGVRTKNRMFVCIQQLIHYFYKFFIARKIYAIKQIRTIAAIDKIRDN